MPIPWNVWHIWNASWWGSPIKHLSGSFGKWVSEWETWVVPSVFSVTQLLHSHARHLCGVQKAFLPGCLQDGVGDVLQMRFTWEEYCPLRQLLQCVQHWWLLQWFVKLWFCFPQRRIYFIWAECALKAPKDVWRDVWHHSECILSLSFSLPFSLFDRSA